MDCEPKWRSSAVMMESATRRSSGASVAYATGKPPPTLMRGEVAQCGEDRFGTAYSELPRRRVELLRSDVEAHAFRAKSQRPGMVEQVDRFGGSAPELVAERRYR